MDDEEVALEFLADTAEGVANVREFVAVAQELADTAKEATDGVAGMAAPAAEAGDAIKGVADSSTTATEALAGYSDEQKQAAAAAGDLAAAQARVKAASAEVKDAVSELAGIQSTAGKDSSEYAAQLDVVTGAMQRQAAAADQLKGVQDQQAAAAAQAKTAAEDSAAATEATATASAEAATATEAAGTAQAGAATKSDVAASSLGKYKMALVATAVGAAVAVDAAGKFQDSTTHLVTDAGESAKNLAMVQQGILGVSAATGTSASQITDAMYHIESSGFHGAQGLAILKTTAEGAKVGGADLDTTSKALIGTLTAYYGTSLTAGQATKDSTSLMNQLITTVGSGDMRMQDLASSLSNVTPVAAAAKISFADVGGALATMTAQGMSARQASQNLAHAIRSLASPTNVQSVEMKAMGLSANDVAKNVGKTGLAGTFQELSDAVLRNTKGGNVMLDMMRGMTPASKGLADQIVAGSISTHDLTSAMKELNPQQYALVSHFKSAAVSVTGMQQTYTSAMSKMLGGATGLNVGLMLTGTHMKDLTTATKNIAAEGAKASTTVDNWSVIQGTFKFKMDQTKASLQDTGIALGSALLPAVTAILGPIAHFLALIAGNKAAAIAFAFVIGSVLAGAIGTKAVKAVTEFKSAVETTVGGVSKLVTAITGIGKAQDAAASASEGASAKEAAAAGEAAAAQSEAAGESAAAVSVSADQVEASWAAAAEAGEAASDAAATAQEADAAEVAVANDEAAAESSASWVVSAAKAVAAAAVWVAQSVAKVAVVVAGNVAGAASTLAAWVATGAGMVAQAAVWVAGTIAKVAVIVAANIAGAVATGAAWVIANGIMLLGIGLVVAAVALAVYEIVTHWKSIVHGVEEAFDAVKKAVTTAVDAVVDFVKSHWMLLLGILLGPIALAVALIATYWKQISSFAEEMWHDVSGFVSNLASDVFGFFERMASDVTGAERRMISDVTSDVRKWISDFLSTVLSGLDNIVHFFEQLPGRILSGLGNIGSLLVNVGKNIVIGLVNGIESMGSFLANAILDLIPSPIRSIVSSVLGIFSPSTVFHGYGVNLVQGLINGVRSMQPQLHAAMTGMTGTVTGAGSAYAASAISPAAGGTSVHVSVPVTATGTAVDFTDPRYKQALQAAVQQVTLEYAGLNATNGLTPAWGR